MPASRDAARRRVVITADDFGWTDSQNRRRAGAAAGTLHRASLLCNGQAFSEAVAIAGRYPGWAWVFISPSAKVRRYRTWRGSQSSAPGPREGLPRRPGPAGPAIPARSLAAGND